MTAEPKFQKKQKEIERYLSRKNRKTITLNEEKLRQERDADKTEGDEKKKKEEKKNPDEKKADAPVFPKAFYNDEILSISIDYIDLLKNQKTAKE